jgi:hypothetical protein
VVFFYLLFSPLSQGDLKEPFIEGGGDSLRETGNGAKARSKDGSSEHVSDVDVIVSKKE